MQDSFTAFKFCSKEHPDNILTLSSPKIILILRQVPESSPASEALQLIFADSGLDSRSIMLDLSKLLNDDPNLAHQLAGNNQRITLSAPQAPPMLIPKRSQVRKPTSQLLALS